RPETKRKTRNVQRPDFAHRAALTLRAGPASQCKAKGIASFPPRGGETLAGPRLALPGGRITGPQPRPRVRAPAEVSLMGTPVQPVGVRVLSLQMTSHALIFAAQSASSLAERALLAADTAATAALGLGWSAFCLLQTFTTNVVSVCPLVVGRCAGD